MNKNRGNRRIGDIIGSDLLRVFLIVFLLSILVIILVQTLYAKTAVYQMIERYVKDVIAKTDDDFDERMEEDTEALRELIEDNFEMTTVEWMKEMVELNPDSFSEINIIDENGVITASTKDDVVGYDMHSGHRSSEFLCLLEGTEYFAQQFRADDFDEKTVMAYAGRAFKDRVGFVEIGVSEETYRNRLKKAFQEEVRHRRIGLVGYIAVLNEDYECIGSTGDIMLGRVMRNKVELPTEEEDYVTASAKLQGKKYYLVSTKKYGYYIIGAYPADAAVKQGAANALVTVILIIAMLITVYVTISRSLKIGVVKSIEDIDKSLTKITDGDLTTRVDVTSSLEFEELSAGINQTVERLNQMIEEADKRLDKELEMARIIQSTSLPNVFPPYPQRTDIGLHAVMDTAKKVGGDFYDYYLLSDKRLAFVIADVSDKGIPAALFMMRAKTAIKALAVSGMEVNEVMMRANDELDRDNEARMFVTVWIGFLDLDTGLVKYVHAGHTCPELIRNGEVSAVRQKRNFIVGGSPGIKYALQELQLQPGDALFLYTDGVTEAFDAERNEYGAARLEEALRKVDREAPSGDANAYCEKVCNFVREDVAAFVNGEQQSDDITMLCLKYVGSKG